MSESKPLERLLELYGMIHHPDADKLNYNFNDEEFSSMDKEYDSLKQQIEQALEKAKLYDEWSNDKSEFKTLDEKKNNWQSELSHIFHQALGGVWSDDEEQFHWWLEAQLEQNTKIVDEIRALIDNYWRRSFTTDLTDMQIILKIKQLLENQK